MTHYAADLRDVRAAAERIAAHAHRTPVMTSHTLDELAGRRIFLKCEQFQKVGAFKFRGALNAVLCLDEAQARLGVVTHSSGNHAQALALAARLRGIPAYIVMPRTAPAAKQRATVGYGAQVVLCEPNVADREASAARVQAEPGATMIPPYAHPPIIAGQGPLARALMAQAPARDAIVAPVGGGGMISGIAIAARGVDPRLRVFAAEPAGADDAARSKAAGRLIPQTGPDTICDGLLTSLGEHTWPVVRDLVEEVITVDDDPILSAMRMVWERMKLVIEPSAATGVAAVLSSRFRGLEGLDRVGVVLSGGNLDLERLPWSRGNGGSHVV